MTYIAIVRHPRSGERYAVETGPNNGILRAAGPLEASEPTDEWALEDLLNNQPEAEDDALWLAAELRA